MSASTSSRLWAIWKQSSRSSRLVHLYWKRQMQLSVDTPPMSRCLFVFPNVCALCSMQHLDRLVLLPTIPQLLLPLDPETKTERNKEISHIYHFSIFFCETLWLPHFNQKEISSLPFEVSWVTHNPKTMQLWRETESSLERNACKMTWALSSRSCTTSQLCDLGQAT